MLSVIIPTLNAAARLPLCLGALVAPAVGGLVKEVIVVDGGSQDDSAAIAEGFGAKILTAPPGRGGQLAAGAREAKGEWLLFLHGDTVLEEGWAEEAAAFIVGGGEHAGVFTLRFDAVGLAPRLLSTGAMLRTRVFKSPYGDQGLLMSRALYDKINGYADMPIMEDVDIIHRIIKQSGHRALSVLNSTATTSAARYERDGYCRRVLKNFWTLARYHAGVSPDELARGYR